MNHSKSRLGLLIIVFFISFALGTTSLYAITNCYDYTWYMLFNGGVGNGTLIKDKNRDPLRGELLRRNFLPFNIKFFDFLHCV